MSGGPIGRLRCRVSIETPDETPDGGGGVAVSWRELAVAWAAIEPRSGSERVSAGKRASFVSHIVTLRYRPDITAGMRLRLEGRLFDIFAVIDVDERRRWLRLHCEERDL